MATNRTTFVTWKTLVLALTCGLIAWYAAWFSLPLSPRAVIPMNERQGEWTFSHDFRFVASFHGEECPAIDIFICGGKHFIRREDGVREWRGSLRVWDTKEQVQLFDAPRSEELKRAPCPTYFLAFTPEADKLVVFCEGKSMCHKVSTGEKLEPSGFREFAPASNQLSEPGQIVQAPELACDVEGNLFVLIQNPKQKRVVIHDIKTGRETGVCDGADFIWQSRPGGVIASGANRPRQLHHIPSGVLAQEFADPAHQHWVHPGFSSDCKAMVAGENGTLKIWNGNDWQTNGFPDAYFPALSPDGKWLTLQTHEVCSYPEWLAGCLRTLGFQVGDTKFYLVILDYQTGHTVARFRTRKDWGMEPKRMDAHFSLDGKTLGVLTDESLELYDLPLSKPWSLAIVIAAGVFAAVLVLCYVFQFVRTRSVGKD